MKCPSCGSQIGFRTERAPFAVCSSCQTMVARKNVDLEAIGKIAECQPDGSPVQVGTQGSYKGKAFEVVGRIQLTYGEGFWNEWFLRYSDGSEGWLGEALGQFFINRQKTGHPDLTELSLGSLVDFDGDSWVVLDRKNVGVSSFEGELPYIVSTQGTFLTVDLRNKDGEGLTVDCSDDEPTTYRGDWVPFDALSLTGLNRDENPMIAVPSSEVRPIKCTNCGAPHEITGPGRAEMFVCQYCDTAMDVRNPELKVMQSAFRKVKLIAERASIPIGTTAKFPKAEYRVIGLLENSTTVQGKTYRWNDFLLYNHLHGYLWLNETNGHYTLFEQLYTVPVKRYGLNPFKRVVGDPPNSFVVVDGDKYKHFSTANVKVSAVLGEFYWRVKSGEASRAQDYVNPPQMVSASKTSSDITWTRGRYLTKSDLKEIFPTLAFPEPVGVGTAQPNPYKAARKAFFPIKAAGYILAFLMIVSGVFLPGGEVLAENVDVNPSSRPKTTFEVPGSGLRNVRVDLQGDLKEQWIDGNVILNPTSGRYKRQRKFTLASLKGKGQDKVSVMVYGVPTGQPIEISVTGKYGPAGTAPPIVSDNLADKTHQMPPLKATVAVAPGARNFSGLFYMWLLLLLPNWLLRRGQSRFETKRWYESDYG